MNNFEIRKASPKDCETLRTLAITTFLEAYSEGNSEENMRNYLAEHFTVEQLALEINNPFSEFYLAVSDHKAIGFLKINFGEAQTELQDKNAIEIERIYVLSDFYGQKTGQLLFNKALEIAKEREATYLWLGVWKKNHRAIRFYEKNGLTVFGTHLFKFGTEEQIDLMMKMELQ